MNKATKKLTPEQQKAIQDGVSELERAVSAEAGNQAIKPVTARQAPKLMWACTPEFKLKANNPMIDLQLTPEQTKGGVIRIVRVGSNKIKICSMVSREDLADGVAEAKEQAKREKKTKKDVHTKNT